MYVRVCVFGGAILRAWVLGIKPSGDLAALSLCVSGAVWSLLHVGSPFTLLNSLFFSLWLLLPRNCSPGFPDSALLTHTFSLCYRGTQTSHSNTKNGLTVCGSGAHPDLTMNRQEKGLKSPVGQLCPPGGRCFERSHGGTGGNWALRFKMLPGKV